MIERDDPHEMLRLGHVSYSEWADYAWKNELHEQKDRVIRHFGECVQGEQSDHNPHHMLERAFSVASFCMRRLIECRLVTDAFCEAELSICEIRRKTDSKAHSPFQSATGGDFFNNFDMKLRVHQPRKPKFIADKFLHARYIAVLSGSYYLPDGLLVASDHQSVYSLFHMKIDEFDRITRAFLDDHITIKKDWIDIKTGEVHADRI